MKIYMSCNSTVFNQILICTDEQNHLLLLKKTVEQLAEDFISQSTDNLIIK